MSSTEVGRAAETAAATWLEQRGFIILSRNWRTRWCELDIVAKRSATIHFVEVKYRRRPDFGTGFEYITAEKSVRLQRAAMMWLKTNSQTMADYQIDIATLSGAIKPENVQYIANAISGA